MSFNILCIDGGGVKGLYSSQIIRRCQEIQPFLETTDLYSGASTGAIIALGLAAGMPVESVVKLYQDNLKTIFKDSYFDDIRDLGNLIGADYNCTNLKEILVKYFSDRTLGELKTKVLIPTFDLDNNKEPRTWKPKFFNNYQEADLNEKVVDVLLRTTAAPTYFPTYQGFADGGLAANSTGVCAIAQVMNIANVELEDINLLSIGPGYFPTYLSGKELDWGISQWAPLLVDAFFDNMKFVTEYQCQSLLKDRFYRIDDYFPKKVALDDISKLDDLLEYADKSDISEAVKWIEKYWKNTQKSEN